MNWRTITSSRWRICNSERFRLNSVSICFNGWCTDADWWTVWLFNSQTARDGSCKDQSPWTSQYRLWAWTLYAQGAAAARGLCMCQVWHWPPIGCRSPLRPSLFVPCLPLQARIVFVLHSLSRVSQARHELSACLLICYLIYLVLNVLFNDVPQFLFV